jgi:hypothetical protein
MKKMILIQAIEHAEIGIDNETGDGLLLIYTNNKEHPHQLHYDTIKEADNFLAELSKAIENGLKVLVVEERK